MKNTPHTWQIRVQHLVDTPLFGHTIIALILFNALILGLETNAQLVDQYADWFKISSQLVLAAFIIEALLKILAVVPRLRLYFGDGWNIFDFSIIILSLLPATGELAMLARLARLLRVLRLISAIPELRLIVTTLIRSVPSMGNIMLLMSIIFYIYAIAGFHLFHVIDPQHWGSLGLALLSLFRIVTLEDWTDLMYTAMDTQPWSWLYFVSFVVMGTFVIINLFIAVVLNNLEQAKAEQSTNLDSFSHNDLKKELQNTQQALNRLQQQMNRNM